MGVVFHQAWSKSQWTVLMGYLLPQQMLDAIKHITDDTFSFRKIAHKGIVCVTQSNWVKYVIFVFPRFVGSAEAQVIWGGIVKRLLIAYFIGNICAKKISKSIHVRQSYSKPKVGRFFETRCNCSFLWSIALTQWKWGYPVFSIGCQWRRLLPVCVVAEPDSA